MGMLLFVGNYTPEIHEGNKVRSSHSCYSPTLTLMNLIIYSQLIKTLLAKILDIVGSIDISADCDIASKHELWDKYTECRPFYARWGKSPKKYHFQQLLIFNEFAYAGFCNSSIRVKKCYH